MGRTKSRSPRKRPGEKGRRRRHAIWRARFRLGVDLTTNDLDRIARRIRRQDDDGTFICHKSRRVSVWELRYAGVPMRVFYDRNRHMVVTVMRAKVRNE